MNFVKIHSCPQGSLSYRALTASMLTRQFSAPDKYVQTYWVLRQPLAECRLEGFPYMVITLNAFYIWTYDRQFLVIKIAIQTPFSIQDFATLDTPSLVTNSFSLISRRIYEIILRQSGEIFRLPDITLCNWNWRRINIDKIREK